MIDVPPHILALLKKVNAIGYEEQTHWRQAIALGIAATGVNSYRMDGMPIKWYRSALHTGDNYLDAAKVALYLDSIHCEYQTLSKKDGKKFSYVVLCDLIAL